MDCESARFFLAQLVAKYDSEKETFENPNYNEVRTRQDFINPLFKLLGWDMDNEKRLSQSFREVLYEDKVSIDGNIKHPDYSFRIGNSILFYVEAKKPSVSIKDNKEAALQLRYYGWNTGLTLSILTNFREFAVYDCRVKPDRKDRAHVARLTYFTYHDLLDSQTKFSGGFQTGFDFFANVFVQENIIRGSFDKFIQDDGNRFKKGVITIDESFLQMLEDWRLVLAKALCRTNQEMSDHDLNYIVSAILNRIVFLRFAEGRGIEPFGNLKTAAETWEMHGIYKKLFTLFERADEKYNSGLFDLGRDSHGEHLLAENKVLKSIVDGLYYPSPYAFDIIPVEMLGSVYERFLGSVIHLTPGHHVKVEPKPEVRKAGGVFYTPQYIVDYIVEHTIGDLIKDKTPAEVAKIKVIDPSCGSGSFLLGAYQYLLGWHKNYYTAKYEKERKSPKGLKNDTLTPFGTLATSVKKQILMNNIFGVDIDENAVEITKLSLLLKCLEGETTASIENILLLFHEKVLPNIDGNIRCGNSLIGTDFYAMSKIEFTAKEQLQINAFDWELEFPQIMKNGGFDIVIGNPPWEVVIGKDFKKNLKYLTRLNNYYKHHYKEIQGETNLYRLFIERVITKLLAADGRWGYVMPSSLLNDKSASHLRKLFLKTLPYIEINQFPEKARVFKHVTQDVCIYLFSHVRSLIRVRAGLLSEEDYKKPFVSLPKSLVSKLDKIPLVKSKSESGLLQKLSANETFEQQNVIRFYEGEIHLTKFAEAICAKQTRQSIYSLVRGDAVQRYVLRQSEKDSFVNEKTVLSISNTPKMQDCNTIRLVYQQVVNMQKSRRLNFYLLESKVYVANTCGYAVLKSDDYDIRFLLGLLNSNLLNWRYKLTSSNNHILTNELDKLPFPFLDLSKKSDKELHDQLVSLVKDMLKFKQQESTAILRQKEIIQRHIAATDLMINQLVYRLYDLTTEEIAIIEESYKPH